VQRIRRALRVQRGSAGGDDGVRRLLASDARTAWRARAHVLFDNVPIAGGNLTVDVWRDERFDRGAIRH
jgi:hypothetical protein